ncbi:unnamed protein product, partial [Allacma fusca]
GIHWKFKIPPLLQADVRLHLRAGSRLNSCNTLVLTCKLSGSSVLTFSIPIIMHMSEDKLHIVSVVGAGLLVGTALSVIIPEGMHTLYLSQKQQTANVAVHPSVSQENHGHSESEGDPFSSVGISLVFGFCFMLLVDQCSRSRSSSRDVETPGSPSKRSFTATVGLVVHSAADGIALGAAATTPHAEVEMIVFVAIMLHKAPAAFGLVTFLLHEGLDRNRIRRHLAVFCLAAPIMAIITYFGISPEGKENLSTMNATAIAMLFSAGTFLYVATVHVLPEVTKDSQNGFTRKELVALVLGAIIPLFLTAGASATFSLLILGQYHIS